MGKRSHAEVLADIAAQVVQSYRDTGQGPAETPTIPEPVVVDDSWSYTLPERYQG